jgi:hypothetical protein
MDSTPRFFVQFPHPGGEHHPRGDEMPWNIGRHQRKFLIAPGRYREDGDQSGSGQLVFWGEWEAPSRIERPWPKPDGPPRVLHRPFWVLPDSSGFRQNTDPWIWGDRMLYSNCMQSKKTRNGARSPTSMQTLTRGSVICFGSTINREFCLDTVFVVASGEPWVPIQGVNADPAFLACTANAVATSERDAATQFTLYRSATVDEPVDDMYSFVPAMKADDHCPRFPRPAIHLPELINPLSTETPLGSTRPLSVDEVRDAWQSLREQVLDSKLVLGVWFEVPSFGSP